MENTAFESYSIEYVELYTPSVKPLVYWHTQALGFEIEAYREGDPAYPGQVSYLMKSGDIRLMLSSTYPTLQGGGAGEINMFITQHHYGVKRIVLRTAAVTKAFEASVERGAIPVRFPNVITDAEGAIEEAAIKLYDHAEIVFIDRSAYKGSFRPGYKKVTNKDSRSQPYFQTIDHIASEVRINESEWWTQYLSRSIGTSMVQSIKRSAENKTGMIMQISQSADKKLTFVIAEPESYKQKSKVQDNIDKFGPGIHHLAFATNDIIAATRALKERAVDFVTFPPAYYDLLRENTELAGFDIDTLQENNILIDKEEDTYLLQKFIKPMSDRPFFIYEMVQRVNGYNGFALKNINVLKKAEEAHIMARS